MDITLCLLDLRVNKHKRNVAQDTGTECIRIYVNYIAAISNYVYMARERRCAVVSNRMGIEVGGLATSFTALLHLRDVVVAASVVYIYINIPIQGEHTQVDTL